MRLFVTRSGFPVLVAFMSLFLTGCPQPVPRVPIPSSDASPPTMTWQTYNMQTRERAEIVQDGQSLDVPWTEQYVVTLVAEDPESGVKDVTLSGEVQYVCRQGGQVEEKEFPVETQEMKPMPEQENKAPIRASLVYVVEFGKSGCKEQWVFGGGKLSLSGKAHNGLGGTETRTLLFQLHKQASP